MSLVKKEDFEYRDGGFFSLVPVSEATNCGATEVDVVILETEAQLEQRVIGRNPLSLVVDSFGTLLNQVEKTKLLLVN